jgi:hypothetical protein
MNVLKVVQPYSYQVPNAFQQALSKEKTPVLSDVLCAFEGLLEGLQEFLGDGEYSDAWPAIREGIDKLKTYQGYADHREVPAYTLATRKLIPYLILFALRND